MKNPGKAKKTDFAFPGFLLCRKLCCIFLQSRIRSWIKASRIHSTVPLRVLFWKPSGVPFLQEAERHNLRTFNGLEMLVNQGALAYELWTGRKAPVEVMKQAMKKEYGEC